MSKFTVQFFILQFYNIYKIRLLYYYNFYCLTNSPMIKNNLFFFFVFTFNFSDPAIESELAH